MKRVNLISLLTVLISMVANNVLAYDIEMPNNDGVTIYYVFNEDRTELIVSNNENVKYQGDIVIPSSVTFEGITYSVTGIGISAFADCPGLTSIKIPNSVKSIGIGAFCVCVDLVSVELGNNVESIAFFAFNSTKIYSIILPRSVKQIEFYAFTSCRELADVYCYAQEMPNINLDINFSAFDCSDWIISASKYPTLHVPYELIDYYKVDAQWGKFRDIVPLTDDDPKPTGIISVNSNKNSNDNSVYNLQGHKLSQPQKGLNIIRTNDGKTKKVVVK